MVAAVTKPEKVARVVLRAPVRKQHTQDILSLQLKTAKTSSCFSVLFNFFFFSLSLSLSLFLSLFVASHGIHSLLVVVVMAISDLVACAFFVQENCLHPPDG